MGLFECRAPNESWECATEVVGEASGRAAQTCAMQWFEGSAGEWMGGVIEVREKGCERTDRYDVTIEFDPTAHITRLKDEES